MVFMRNDKENCFGVIFWMEGKWMLGYYIYGVVIFIVWGMR